MGVQAISPSPDDAAAAIATTFPSPDDAASKARADCHTTKTPLWREGPEGPKAVAAAAAIAIDDDDDDDDDDDPFLVQSLCNVCGICYRKRRRQTLGMDADPQSQHNKDRKLAVVVGLPKGDVLLKQRH